MVDFERSTTVGMSADAAFALLADPMRVPDYVPLVTHVDSTAEDGAQPEAEPGAATTRPGGVRETRFLADAAARVIEWGNEGSAYAGSMTVEPGTASTSQVTIRLRTREDVDRARVDDVMDQAVRGLRRMLSGH